MDAVEKCHQAGIRVIMITGDYGLTGNDCPAYRHRSGRYSAVVTGVDLEQMSDEDLRKAVEDEIIFARVAPEHKLRVVSALQADGKVVAVTGDGVNDAPALKANIGVAMGITGSDVAKEAADGILTDDNFGSIVSAIEEGRTVYENIKRFTTYVFTSNAPEAIPFMLYALTAGRIPLALGVMHVLAIDLGTDIVPALALGAEPPEPGTMQRPPRKLTDHLITKELLVKAYLILGPVQGFAAMLMFYLYFWQHGFAGRWIDLPSNSRFTMPPWVLPWLLWFYPDRQLVCPARPTAFHPQVPLFNNRWFGPGLPRVIVVAALVYIPSCRSFCSTQLVSNRTIGCFWCFGSCLPLADALRKAIVRKTKLKTLNQKEGAMKIIIIGCGRVGAGLANRSA